MIRSGVTSICKVSRIARTRASRLPNQILIHSGQANGTITDAISKLNDMMVAAKRGLNFSVDEKLGRPIIYVKNTATGEVVRQIPNEVVVRIAHGIEDLKGLLHNKSS